MTELIISAIVVIVVLYFRSDGINKQRKKTFDDSRLKLEEELNLLSNSINNRAEELREVVRKYDVLWNSYVASFPYQHMKKTYSELRTLFQNPKLKQLSLSIEITLLIDKFCLYYDRTDRKEHNKGFIEKELFAQRAFFDNIEGRKLDIHQRTSIISDEDNNLIIAGAGTGKTSTIVGKVKYLIKTRGVIPQKILLISFTRKSVTDLLSRVNESGVAIETFHSYGLKVIRDAYSIPSIFDQEFSSVIKKIISGLKEDINYLEKVNDFFLNYYKREWDVFKTANLGEYSEKMREENMQPLGQKYRNSELSTINMIKVKSIEERKIADFLYCNNIDYEYELPHVLDTEKSEYKKYRPDFTIYSSYGKIIYLEHFGIKENGEPAPIFKDKKKYVEGIRWKRDFHHRNKTVLIESYSYENFKGVLLSNLTLKLRNQGITLKPKSPQEIDKAIQERDREGYKKFYEMVETFLVLLKSNNYSIDTVRDKVDKLSDESDKKRAFKFLEIFVPIYEGYQKYLSTYQYIDFSDMINLASDAIASKKYYFPYDYVLIDEFQDLSIGRYQLLKAMKFVNPFLKIFAVGDDWQSIYRFTGSDIALFKNFQEYFGTTEIGKIETTYRFGSPLIDIGTTFILKNKNQLIKNLKAIDNTKVTDIKLVEYQETGKKTDSSKSIFRAVAEILNELEGQEVMVLGRYNYDIDKLDSRKINSANDDLTDLEKEDQSRFSIFKSDKGEPIIQYTNNSGEDRCIEFMSVHKAKGLECENIILINNESGRAGFPSLRSDDPILNLLLSESDQFENGEERRLFYVALTRAKRKVFLLTPIGNKSKFINELYEGDNEQDKCPNCVKGDLRIKSGVSNTGRQWKMKSCSNFSFGCDYQAWL